ncbi:uncharacterized protein PG986_005887 [Apiospora aurea]|uniref:Mitochondrial F1F0 ATP synthase subunit F n=1 Tax=Apiospora aurea TaxID=335848 RepID=A0ABR1QJ21_9PEZI
MSFIQRRALSTLIPPKIASPTALGAAPDALRMKRVVEPSGLFGRYQAKHFGGNNASAKPIIHAIGIILVIGYPMTYYFHLRHHKNNAH